MTSITKNNGSSLVVTTPSLNDAESNFIKSDNNSKKITLKNPTSGGIKFENVRTGSREYNYFSKNNNKVNSAIIKSLTSVKNTAFVDKNTDRRSAVFNDTIIQNIRNKYESAGAQIPKDMHIVFDKTMDVNTDAYVDNFYPNILKVNGNPDAAITRLSDGDYKRMLTHETLHAVANNFTNSLTNELDDQVNGKWDRTSHSTVLIEGFAELFTEKLTGKRSNLDSADYQAYYDIAKRIETAIGTKTCEKAFFANDTESRHRIIMALSKIQQDDARKTPVVTK